MKTTRVGCRRVPRGVVLVRFEINRPRRRPPDRRRALVQSLRPAEGSQFKDKRPTMSTMLRHPRSRGGPGRAPARAVPAAPGARYAVDAAGPPLNYALGPQPTQSYSAGAYATPPAPPGMSVGDRARLRAQQEAPRRACGACRPELLRDAESARASREAAGAARVAALRQARLEQQAHEAAIVQNAAQGRRPAPERRGGRGHRGPGRRGARPAPAAREAHPGRQEARGRPGGGARARARAGRGAGRSRRGSQFR